MNRDLYEKVYNDYIKHDVEFSSAYLDFDISEIGNDITIAEVLDTYAGLQERTNGDFVVRVENIVFDEKDDKKVLGGKLVSLDDGTLNDIATGKIDEIIRNLEGTGIYRFIELDFDDKNNIVSGELLDLIF